MDNMQQENNASQGSPKPKSKHTGLIMAIILIVVLGAIVFLNKPSQQKQEGQNQVENSQSEQDEQVMENNQENPVPSVTPTPSQTESAEGNTAKPPVSEVKTFAVDANNFSFSIKEIKVKKGDTVKILFNNTLGFHDWVLDEFNAKTPQLEAGKSATVEFVADKTGTFEYYCSVGKHRQNGMVGKLIVE